MDKHLDLDEFFPGERRAFLDRLVDAAIDEAVLKDYERRTNGTVQVFSADPVRAFWLSGKRIPGNLVVDEIDGHDTEDATVVLLGDLVGEAVEQVNVRHGKSEAYQRLERERDSRGYPTTEAHERLVGMLEALVDEGVSRLRSHPERLEDLRTRWTHDLFLVERVAPFIAGARWERTAEFLKGIGAPLEPEREWRRLKAGETVYPLVFGRERDREREAQVAPFAAAVKIDPDILVDALDLGWNPVERFAEIPADQRDRMLADLWTAIKATGLNQYDLDEIMAGAPTHLQQAFARDALAYDANPNRNALMPVIGDEDEENIEQCAALFEAKTRDPAYRLDEDDVNHPT